MLQINSDSKVQDGGWWGKVKEWVRTHTGASQRYINGQPVCNLDLYCGPCPGICNVFGEINAELNDNLPYVSEEKYNEGYRPMLIGIVVNSETSEERILIEVNNDEGEFFSDGNLYIDEDFSLTNEICDELDISSAVLHAGIYPYVEIDGVYSTIVSADIE